MWRQGGLCPCAAAPSQTCASPLPIGTRGLSGGTKIGTVGRQMSASALLVRAWGKRGCTTSPRTCGMRRQPPRLLRGKGTGRRPSSVEEARQWTIGRRYASVFPLSISLCTNRFLPTPPRRRLATSRLPPLQGNSAVMQRDWMAVSRSNLNGPAGNVSSETSLGCKQSFEKGQSVSSP